MKLIYLTFLFCFLTVYSFSKKGEKLPGTVQVNDNFYVDQTEIRNIDWIEFRFWLHYVGENKHKVDSSVWGKNWMLEEMYYGHPVFRDHPVVGITYEDALSYCKWRSDRVFESLLIEEGILEVDMKGKDGEFFSIDKYFEGNWKGIIPDSSRLYPNYRLPTEEEWNYYRDMNSTYPFGYDFSGSKGWFSSSYDTLRMGTKVYPYDSTNFINFLYQSYPVEEKECIMEYVKNWYSNDFDLYGIIGNVSEMTSQKGIAYGGNWTQWLIDIDLSKPIEYKGATNWLGFRCVAEWKTWDYSK